MSPQTIRADEVLQMAHNFRLRAAEAEDTDYHRLMLRTASELEELADDLARKKGSQLTLIDDDEDA